ncbi:ras-related C3 botulinum toxin substrate 1-like [Diadema setosum]|uniref:ras-related C3 botulinum toxin substrate 1-like n=1 Tax=Diadema antillarum TaxID=105358 RepID=UPI003A8A3428
MEPGKDIKCVIVGDGYVGKTCLLISYTTNRFPGEYAPTVFDHYAMKTMVDDVRVSLSLWDTAGQDTYAQVRPLSYANADVFLVCFSTVNIDSRDNVSLKWVPEVRQHQPNTPIILVGTKTDLREDKATLDALQKQKHRPVMHEEGVQISKTVMALAYVECSAKNNDGVTEVFNQAVRAALNPNQFKKKKKRCCII